MSGQVEILLADANVLIDYRDSEITALRLISEHVGPLKTLTLVQEQVRGLSDRLCDELRIEVVEPGADEIAEAARWAKSIGVVDAVCLASAKARHWTCVTNDRALAKACRAEGTLVRRGLGLLVDLVLGELMPRREAFRIAQLMHTTNPQHIHDGVLAKFVARLDGR